MFKEYKYSVWSLSLKLLFIYIGVIIINLLILAGLLTIFADSSAWQWFVQVLSMIVNFGLVLIFASSDGKRDMLVDAANKKRKERTTEFEYENKFIEGKGFLAGIISQAPFIILYILRLILGTSSTGTEILVRVSFSPYFEIMTALGLNVFTVVLFVAMFTAVSGLSYFSAKAYHKKIMTIIKRNEDKARKRGVVGVTHK